MDIWLPDMDGIEATLRVRTADPRMMNPDIPIIGLSAHVATEKEIERFQNAGFNKYVVKPVSFEKLFAAMKEVLVH
jgi:two-component system secretion sensor histidine kinase SsrA